MGASSSTKLHNVKAQKIVGFNPEDGGNRFLRNADIFSHTIRRDFAEISNPVSWKRRQNVPPKVGKTTSGFRTSHPRRYNAGTLKTTVIHSSEIFVNLYETTLRGHLDPDDGSNRLLRKVGEFLSHCKISYSRRQKSSLSRAWRPRTSQTAINFADERGDFWPNC